MRGRRRIKALTFSVVDLVNYVLGFLQVGKQMMGTKWGKICYFLSKFYGKSVKSMDLFFFVKFYSANG